MNNPATPGASHGELSYVTEDGLFRIDAEALKSGPGGSDYVPVWLTDLSSGIKVCASGNPDPTSKHTQNNDITVLSGKFSHAAVDIRCYLN